MLRTGPAEQEEIDGIVNHLDAGFVDTYRHIHPEKVEYSWWSFRANARARNVGWRIDYFLSAESITDRVKDAFIYMDMEGSDHCPVGIYFE